MPLHTRAGNTRVRRAVEIFRRIPRVWPLRGYNLPVQPHFPHQRRRSAGGIFTLHARSLPRLYPVSRNWQETTGESLLSHALSPAAGLPAASVSHRTLDYLIFRKMNFIKL